MDKACIMSITITLKISTGSAKQRIIASKKKELKCFLKNQPKKGMANRELIALLAKKLGIAQFLIEIIHGLTSRKKIIHLDVGLTLAEIYQKLGIDYQKSLFKEH